MMRYLALVTDYDETLAVQGHVAPPVIESLKRVKASGRKLILATGRELPDLLSVFPDVTLFDLIVGENGAVLYNPITKEEKLLVEPPPKLFFHQLQERRVEPLSHGRIIISTRNPQEHVVLDVIRELGLELSLSFNKGSVMILPSGVNKATGLQAALKELKLEATSIVGIGDAENDVLFLQACACSAAVANAIPLLKEQVDIVTSRPAGDGVCELIERLLADDLKNYSLA
jgi:hydroxymethylpyrimidine pyrophosphatase-like HAD family hydrolase